MEEVKMTTGTGSCHCEAVTFEFTAPAVISVYRCNCSICVMKGNVHFVVPKEKFTISQESLDNLSLYQFGTKTARHLTCKTCGVTPFYQPRSNPEGWAITIMCVKNKDEMFDSITTVDYDGQNWEKQYEIGRAHV